MVKLKKSSDFSAGWLQSETREKMQIVQKGQGERSVLRDPSDASDTGSWHLPVTWQPLLGLEFVL